ncbi:hypothetical protein, conserved [Babesia bigemina]|uniref:t-SNARE coiled-coil homology domain-containing protein n=1 Tax=Babesia bigemina TaxID=5866 RepID=A0A061DEI4_BABBI|nr:hypothetical protein, conserved [Babesia bigemina]CDR97335.1 hypothetical protein, conserved [Babesia bigemina]|eukprot:XP_012769521.1 hypothetical protein, conserved [Babesia bigemina]
MVGDTSEAAQNLPDPQLDLAAGKANLSNLDFNAQVQLILQQNAAINADIRERDQIRHDKTAHPLAQIKLTARIDARVEQVRVDLDILHNIYERITSSRRHRKKYTDEELDNFEDTIQNLEEQCSTYDSSRYRRTTTVKRRINMDFTPPSDSEPMTEEEQLKAMASIQRWRTRDEQFDQQLQEIGEAVERIGEVAVVIGERANEQVMKAVATMEHVEDATEDVTSVSQQIKSVLRKQKTVECSIRAALIASFVVVACLFVYSLIRFLKNR